MPSWLWAKTRRLQGTLSNTFTSILVTLCLPLLSQHKLGVVVTDGGGCWMLPPFAVLSKTSLIGPCPRLHIPQSSEHRHGWRAHLPFPRCLPSPQKLPQRRITECTNGDAAVLRLNTEIWTLASHSSPQSELGFQPRGGSAGLTLLCGPSVNPELLDSRHGITLPAQSSHAVFDTELAEQMFAG